MKELNLSTSPIENKFPPKVLQFGGGNFLRAFTNWMIEVLNDETEFAGSSVIVKPTERGQYADLIQQNGLFHVVLNGIENNELVSATRLISNVTQVENPYKDWNGFLATATIPSIRFIISNTTEAGIQFNQQDAQDVFPPKEFPAKLTHWLYTRYKHFSGAHDKGCILLPCELIEENGQVLKSCILRYADFWNLDSEFKLWIEQCNYFCDTLVDRIVSGFPTDRKQELTESLGYDDKLLVAAELYHSWVIEGNSVVQEAFPVDKTNLNVQFVKDLRPYRVMKVKVLNGAHTALVPVGYLSGLRMVEEVMADEQLCQFVENILFEEVAPTINLPEHEVHAFINDVLDRFRNKFLKHKLISISLNSTSKFVTRLLPTLREYQQMKGGLPQRIVLSLAALIRFYKGSIGSEIIAVNDAPSTVEFFSHSWGEYESGAVKMEQMVQNILGNESIWQTDLSAIEGLVALTSTLLTKIDEQGMVEVTKEIDGKLSMS